MFGTMIVLSIVPDASVITVVGRLWVPGYCYGLVTGWILVSDLAPLMLAVYSLPATTEIMGNLFIVVKYLGGAYFIGFGLGYGDSEPQLSRLKEVKKSLGSQISCLG